MNHVVDIRPLKNELRLASRQYRTGLSADEKERLDRKIQNKFLNMWQYREADVILIYVATAIEVETRLIIETALKDGKTVAVPRCVDGTREMEFYKISGYSQLEKHTFGVLEPKPDECEKLEDFSKGVCVVPALVFDRSGCRLGYGGGYYDRFLSNFSGETVGLCYNECVKDSIPHGKYDRRVEKIITQNSVINTKTEGGR